MQLKLHERKYQKLGKIYACLDTQKLLSTVTTGWFKKSV